MFKTFFFIIAEVWFIQFSLKNTIKNGTNLTYARYLRLMEILPAANSAY